MGNKPSSLPDLVSSGLQEAYGHDGVQTAMPTMPPFLCLVRHEAPQVQKLQSCISQHCHNSSLDLLLQACLFSQDSRSIRRCEEYSYYFIPQDQMKKNQINSVKHKQRNRGFIITLTIKPCLNHRAFLNSLSDLLR